MNTAVQCSVQRRQHRLHKHYVVRNTTTFICQTLYVEVNYVTFMTFRLSRLR